MEFPDSIDKSEVSRHEVALIIKHGSNDPSGLSFENPLTVGN